MKTDTKKVPQGLGPGAHAEVKLRKNGHPHYTQNLKKSRTLSVKERCALWWLKQDFLILPVQPNSKRLVPGHGPHRNKITFPEQVYQWFGDRSLANIAVCGTQTSLILDFDDSDLYKFWAGKFSDAARTYTEQTPRGGYHVFAHVWGESLKGFMPVKGVELKRVALIFPSSIDDKQYTHGAGSLLNLDADQILSPLRQLQTTIKTPRVESHGKGILPQIKSAFSCLDLVRSADSTAQIYGSGKRFISLRCPFHEDKEPSFWIDTEQNLWGCHACGTTGDVINLFARLHGLTVRDAIQEMRSTL
jgi:hypothetical protein